MGDSFPSRATKGWAISCCFFGGKHGAFAHGDELFSTAGTGAPKVATLELSFCAVAHRVPGVRLFYNRAMCLGISPLEEISRGRRWITCADVVRDHPGFL